MKKKKKVRVEFYEWVASLDIPLIGRNSCISNISVYKGKKIKCRTGDDDIKEVTHTHTHRLSCGGDIGVYVHICDAIAGASFSIKQWKNIYVCARLLSRALMLQKTKLT